MISIWWWWASSVVWTFDLFSSVFVSRLPFYSSWVVALILLSVVWWKILGLMVGLLLILYLVFNLVCEVIDSVRRYVSGFWVFIVSELIIFISLFVFCLWSRVVGDFPISSVLELPFLGCFLLIGSSIAVTSFHYHLGYTNVKSFLIYTIILGLCFVIMQLVEFSGSDCDILTSVYVASSFITVCLHFIHVVVGLVLLVSVYVFWGENFKGIRNIDANWYYSDLVVWYWHFVDYIWLLVFSVVYFL